MSRPGGVEYLLALAAAPRVRQALTVVVLASSLASQALRVVYGWPGAIAVLAALCLLAALSLIGMRDEIEWRGILPVSLLALVGWISLSVLWSTASWWSLVSVLYLLGHAFLGVYVALARDLIQLVRALGDALRAILVVSLAFEILSGILLDMPIPFLGIAGNLAEGGPIQGIAGTRNHLGFLAGLAIVTFLIEYRTRSVSRLTSGISLGVAVILVAFSGSPVTIVVLAAVGLAGLVLWGVRRIPASARRAVQPAILGAALVVALAAWLLRGRILAVLDATSDFESRTSVWRRLLPLIEEHPVEGWGWVGIWPRTLSPYSTVFDSEGHRAGSALNAYVDVWLQIGLVGLALFAAALGLGLVRSWLVASEARSTVNVWPALTLLILAFTGLAESYPLVEGGLVLLVAACIAAARKRSWRGRLREEPRGLGGP